MGRKMNNMPLRKKKKDKSNPQIRGKAGLGRNRTKGRTLRQKERSKHDTKLERGELPVEPPKERARPEGYVQLARRQEERVSADVEESEEKEESRRAKKRRKKAGAGEEAPQTDLLERSHIPQAGLREGTVDLSPGEDEDGGTLAEHRPTARKPPTASYCPSFCSSGVCARGGRQGELWPRASVRLAGLQGAAELNGRTASCSSWDTGKERWLVCLDGGSEVKALKPSNLRLRAAQDAVALRPGSCVRILGLKGAAALNGEQATCITWDKDKQRWLVRLQSSLERLLRPENLKLHGSQEATLLRVGAAVCLSGLQAAPELNGKLGVCLGWDEAKQRWRVRLEGGLERLLKPDNMEVETTPEGLLVSPLVSQTVTFCKAKEKLEQLLQFLKKLRLEERKGLRPRSLVAVFCRDVQSLQAVLEGLHQAQLPCIGLHGGMNKQKRESSLATFRLDQKPIALITADASHGLKSEHLRCMVNYDFPRGLAQYGDRIRRVFREGAEGSAHSFFTKESAPRAAGLVSLLDSAMAPVEPALRELAARRGRRSDNVADATAKPGVAPAAVPGTPGPGKRKRKRSRLRNQRKQGKGGDPEKHPEEDAEEGLEPRVSAACVQPSDQ